MNAQRTILATLLSIFAVGCFDSDEVIEPDTEDTDSDRMAIDFDGDVSSSEGGGSWMSPADEDCAGSIGCACVSGECAQGLSCVAGTCGPCVAGQLGCACEGNTTCDTGLACVDADEGNVCARESVRDGFGCDHGLALNTQGVATDGACLASCVDDAECDWLVCSDADGFCVAQL